MYFAGISEESSNSLCKVVGMQIGRLPVRYLGVPLITSRLSYKNCLPILEKIQAKVKNWAIKALSYRGRFQLVKSVFSGIHMYWSSIFILAKMFIKKIASMMASFL